MTVVQFYNNNRSKRVIAEYELGNTSRLVVGDTVALANDPNVDWEIEKVEEKDGALLVGLKFLGVLQ